MKKILSILALCFAALNINAMAPAAGRIQSFAQRWRTIANEAAKSSYFLKQIRNPNAESAYPGMTPLKAARLELSIERNEKISEGIKKQGQAFLKTNEGIALKYNPITNTEALGRITEQYANARQRLNTLLNEEKARAQKTIGKLTPYAIGTGIGAAAIYSKLNPNDKQQLDAEVQDLEKIVTESANLLKDEVAATPSVKKSSLGNIEASLKQTARKLTDEEIEAMPELTKQELDILGID